MQVATSGTASSDEEPKGQRPAVYQADVYEVAILRALAVAGCSSSAEGRLELRVNGRRAGEVLPGAAATFSGPSTASQQAIHAIFVTKHLWPVTSAYQLVGGAKVMKVIWLDLHILPAGANSASGGLMGDPNRLLQTPVDDAKP